MGSPPGRSEYRAGESRNGGYQDRPSIGNEVVVAKKAGRGEHAGPGATMRVFICLKSSGCHRWAKRVVDMCPLCVLECCRWTLAGEWTPEGRSRLMRPIGELPSRPKSWWLGTRGG